VATEFADQFGPARGNRIEHVTNVNSRDGARGAAQLIVTRKRERDNRPPQPVLHAARHETDYALVPRFIEQTDAAAMQSLWAWVSQPAHCIESIGLHARLYGPALEIELVQAPGKTARLEYIIREQAADAD
jgi:hypothetical protein